MKKNLLITLGDPYSINSECLAKTLFNPQVWEEFSSRTTLIGSERIFAHQLQKFGINFAALGANFISIDHLIDAELFQSIDPLNESLCGQVVCRSLEKAADILKQNLDQYSVLSCPIDKFIAAQSGFDFSGQTEFFESVSQRKGLMCLAGPKLKVGLVTNHVPLKNVSDLLTIDLVAFKLSVFASGLQKTFGIQNPRIAVLGLNPHASDHGLFGCEEAEVIQPAIAKFNQDLNQVKAVVAGPMPADTAFYKCMTGAFDGVLAMYHDQGLGPLKTVHFDTAINVTMGLDFLRVSPDHGPAKDLFGTGRASFESFQTALNIL